jgi:hypothetical protein
VIEGLYVIVTTWRAFFHSFDANRGKFVLSEQIRTLPGNRGAVTTSFGVRASNQFQV